MRLSVAMGVVLLVALTAAAAQAGKMQWLFSEANVAWSDAEAGEYVLEWEFPERLSGMRIEYATLELRMDSTPWAEGRTPYVVQISRVDGFSRGDGTYTLAGEEPTSAVSVSAGRDAVVLDVTRLVRSWRAIDGPVFSLVTTGESPEAVPALRTGDIAPGVVAKLTIYAINR